MKSKLKSPFPYFGGKARTADAVWRRLGVVDGYIEPFAGSAANALLNPNPSALKSENINDRNGFICNFWRSVALEPDAVAAVADWPVNHIDLRARRAWMFDRAESTGLVNSLCADPDYRDAERAGVWLWGSCQWIGSQWDDPATAGHNQRPHLGDHGMGIHSIGQRPHLRDHGRSGFYQTMTDLAQRLRYTRVTCCDWSSLCSSLHKTCQVWGVFLDPPYTEQSGRDMRLYCNQNGHGSVGLDVAAWALEIGERSDVRVALCGIEGEYSIPDTWERYYWKTNGYSYGNRDRREVIWFSPHCVNPQPSLFESGRGADDA